jgi:hypothetical protein
MSAIPNDVLPPAGLKMATEGELLTDAQNAISLRNLVVRAHDDFEKRREQVSRTAASRFKSSPISDADKARMIAAEIDAFLGTARDELIAAVEDAVKKLGAIKERMEAQRRHFWTSKVAILMSQTSGMEQRARYQANLAAAGKAQLEHSASVAVGSNNHALAAAVVVANECKPSADRGAFSGGVLAERMDLPAWTKATGAFQLFEENLKAVLLLYRTLKQTRSAQESIGAANIARGLRQRSGADAAVADLLDEDGSIRDELLS